MKKLLILGVFLIFLNCYALATDHSGTILNDETWLFADNPHICTGNVTISSISQPTLTIEPGVIVKFDPGKAMYVGNATSADYVGGLIAVGTESNPITFTSNSATPEAGDWDYIQFRSHCIDANCRIENAIIEYGGLASPYALYIVNTPAIINDVTFQNNTGSGIKLNNFGTGIQRPEITNCSFIGNTDYPIQIYANDILALGEGNTFSGNGTDEIYVYGEYVVDDQDWLNHGIPYYINNDLTLSANGGVTLNIQYGSILKFNAQKNFTIGHYSIAAYWGTLNATGVEFSGTVDTPGHWDGLIYNNYSEGGILSGCTIKNAGSGSRSVYITTSGSLTQQTITGCQIINGLGDGLYLGNDCRPILTGNTISGHSDYPISIFVNDVGWIGSNNGFTENGIDLIEVRSGTIVESQTWNDHGIPYYINNDLNLYADGGVTLNIQYGAVLKFAALKDFTIGHASIAAYWGTLNATGVEFEGSIDTPGHWRGLVFNNYSNGGILSGCTIKNAGYGATPRSVYMTTVSSLTQQTITGCQIIDGQGDGLYLGNDCRPILSGNTISGHSDYPISVFVNDVGSIGPNNSFTGNGTDVIEVRSGNIDESQIWNDHGIPYLLTNHITIWWTSFPHLQIMPGCIIQLKQGDYIQVGHLSLATYKGSMEAEGVTFTRASVGEIHRGIYFAKFSEDANCILTDCIVEYGGYDDTSYNAGIIITQSAPTLNHVTFRNNDGFGLRINDITEGNDLPVVMNCRFYDNAEHPVKIYSSELSCLKEDNVYSGNNPERIYVNGDYVNYDAEWINQGIPFDIYGNITVWHGSAPHLIINSGITLMFGSGNYMNIGHSTSAAYTGSIEATGVTFTGKTNTSGDWAGLRFNKYGNYALTELDKCTIEYATTNILCTNSSPLIKQCVIGYAQNYGIKATSSLSVPNIFKCSIYNNDVGIYCNSGGSPTIGGETGNANSITDNTTYGVQNTSTSVTVNATYNWWGDATGPYNATANPGGSGNPVSDYVDFTDFLTTSLAEAPSLFDLFSPAMGDTLWSFDSVLDWETSIDPTPSDTVRYRLELSTTDNYTPETTITINDIEGSQFLLSDNEIDDDTRYWWRVTAYDLGGLETNSSQQNWYFDVFVIDPPDYFTLISPNNMETVYETSILLTWNAAIDSDPGDNIFYTVYLDETASFSDPDSVVTTETGVYTPFCQPGTLFYWTVKATDTYGESTYSDVRSFYVDPSAGPRAPRLVNIALSGNNFDLNWEAVPGADSYEIEHSTEPYSGFVYLDSSPTNNYTHVDAAIVYTKSFYRIKAIDNDLILYWRDLSGNRLE